MSNLDEIRFNYAIYYKFIGLKVRGHLSRLFIFKEYWYGRRVDKYYVPTQTYGAERVAQKTLFGNAVRSWQGLDQPTKHYYNIWAKYKHFSGYNRYLSLYIKANYPLVLGDYLLKEDADKVLQEDGSGLLLNWTYLLLETGDFLLLETSDKIIA